MKTIMPQPKLSRDGFHEFNVHQVDSVNLWSSGRLEQWNLSVETRDGGKLRLYNLTVDHLSQLAAEIAAALGRMPDITRADIRECYDKLGRILGRPTAPSDDRPPPISQSAEGF